MNDVRRLFQRYSDGSGGIIFLNLFTLSSGIRHLIDGISNSPSAIAEWKKVKGASLGKWTHLSMYPLTTKSHFFKNLAIPMPKPREWYMGGMMIFLRANKEIISAGV